MGDRVSSPARRGGGLLFAGSLLGAALGYVFFVVLNRALSAADLGAVGSLINVATIASVPGLGLQLVTARAVARASDGSQDSNDASAGGASLPAAVRGSVLVGVALAVVLGVGALAIAPLLHLGGPGPVIMLALSAVPMTVSYVGFGVLQGTQRLGALGLCLLSVGLTKFAAALIAAGLGLGVTGVMGWYAAGWLVTLALAWWPAHGLLAGGSGGAAPGSVGRVVRDGLQATVPTAGLLVLSSLDLLLARHYLSASASGAYTVGALFEKVAFWGPSFLATMYYAQMAQPAARRRAVLTALGATGAVGAVGIAVAAVAGGPLVALVGGAGYAELGPLVWLFTALGVGLAVAQVLVYADVAAHGSAVGRLVWVAAAAAVALVWLRHDSVVEVVASVAACVLALVVAVTVMIGRSLSRVERHTSR